MFIEKSSLLSSLPEKVLPTIIEIVNLLHAHHARLYVVGGAVRDYLLGLSVNDIDIEIHDITPERLEEILARFGSVHYDGKSFGVLRVGSLPVDWSLPRKDSSGRKPLVEIDPFMDITQALKRRDLTMNAMAIDLVDGTLIDPFGGQKDLKDGVLATPDPMFFVQDPLRFYRVMQFIGRFSLYPNTELQDLCKHMDVSQVSVERIHAECDKLITLSAQPSRGFRWLRDIDRLKELFPELADTIGVPQEHSWHPEGDVFEHSMQAVDAATRRPCEDAPSACDRRLLIYAALCHDLGKVTTTKMIAGRWRSLGHDIAGVEPARALMKRFTGIKKLIDLVAVLVRHHMAPGHYVSQGAHAKAYKRLAAELAPDLNLYVLAQLAYADKLGRNPAKLKPLDNVLPDIDEFMERARTYGVLYEPEKPLLSGHDIMALGHTGANIGKVVERAYAYQIEQEHPTKETVLRYVQHMLK